MCYQNKKNKVRLNELDDNFDYEIKNNIKKEFNDDSESKLIDF